MSSNLFKAGQVILSSEEPVIVDSNDIIARKMERLQYLIQENIVPEDAVEAAGFQEGLQATEMSALFGEEEEWDEDSAVIKPAPEEEVPLGPTPEELIAQAQEEIEQLRKEAEKGISFLKKQSKEDGYKEGYQEGKNQAMVEMVAMEQELQDRQAQLEQEYEAAFASMEVQLVETLTNIYEQVFQVELADQKQIILYLAERALHQAENAKEFLVHISKEDYPFVAEHREELKNAASSPSTVVEITEDMTLKENQCMIETENGIFDCGLGTQLEELKKKLRLLSYEP